MNQRFTLLLTLALLTAMPAARAGVAPFVKRPGAGEHVADQAGLLQPDQAVHMNEFLAAMLRDLDIELMVAAVPSLEGEEINPFATALFERWAVGGRTRAGRGVLLVIAAAEERVRFEVGYDLEHVFPDAFVSYVEHEQMAPYFSQRRLAQGIEATIELIVKRAHDGTRQHAYDPSAEGEGTIGGFRTGGAGAQAAVPWTGADTRPEAALEPSLRGEFGAQPSAAQAWERFLEYNRRHIKDGTVALFDAQAKAVLGQGLQTTAGQDHIAKLYDGQAYEVRQEGDRAAIVFPEDPDLMLAPWFFRRSAEGWQLDGSMYPEIIGYNHLNQWRFKRRDHPYGFAFQDYRLDANGFARRR